MVEHYDGNSFHWRVTDVTKQSLEMFTRNNREATDVTRLQFQFLCWSSLRSGCLAWCVWRPEWSEWVWRTVSPRHLVTPAGPGTSSATGRAGPPSGASVGRGRTRTGWVWSGGPSVLPSHPMERGRISALSDCPTVLTGRRQRET